MSDIFLSYAREDGEQAEKIAAALAYQGWSVFWDRTIPVGQSWHDMLQRELAEARCVVVLWSVNSTKSQWVREEAEDGHERGILIPVRVEDVRPPMGLRSVMHADLLNWNGAGTPLPEDLIAAIASVLGAAPCVTGAESVVESVAAQDRAEVVAGHKSGKIKRAARVVFPLVAVVALGTWLTTNFVNDRRAGAIADKQQELRLKTWEDWLGRDADKRTHAVNEWIDLQFKALHDLAENSSLQLYVTQLLTSDQETRSAEYTYLRNLLLATAASGGFYPPRPGSEPVDKLGKAGDSGLALTDVTGRVLVATNNMPPISSPLSVALTKAAFGNAAVADLHLGATGKPSMGFAVPIYGIQAEGPGLDRPIGMILGVKLVGQDLYGRLKSHSVSVANEESYLVRRVGATIEYISPLSDGTEPLTLSVPSNSANLAAAFVIDNAGVFAADRIDYRNRPVLVTGRQVANLPWHLLSTAGREEALPQMAGGRGSNSK